MLRNLPALGWSVLAAAGLLAFGALTVWDLDLSRAMVGRAPVFAKAFEVLGLLPLAALAAAAPLVLWVTGPRRPGVPGALRTGGLLLVSGAGTFFGVVQTFVFAVGEGAYDSRTWALPVTAVFLGVFAALVAVFRRLGPGRLGPARRFAWIALGVAAADVVLVEALKLTFGRTRPREMAGPGDFGPWYQVHGPNGHKSFPSAHTAYAFTALVWSFLWKPGTRARRTAAAAALVFGVCTALSRVMIGAHFPTDTAAGAVLALLTVWVFSRVFPGDPGLLDQGPQESVR